LVHNAKLQYGDYLRSLFEDFFINECHKVEWSKRIDMAFFPQPNVNLFGQFFSQKEMKWNRWDFEIENYNIVGIREEEKRSGGPQDTTEDIEATFEEEEEMKGSRDGFKVVDEGEYQDKIEFQNIMIAREDSVKNSFFLSKLLAHNFPVLMVGETGTGKTQSIKKFLNLSLSKRGWETGWSSRRPPPPKT